MGGTPSPILTDGLALTELIEAGLTSVEIAELTGRTVRAVRMATRRYGLTNANDPRSPERLALLDDFELLRCLHYERGLNVVKIAEELRRAPAAVLRKFREADVPTRRSLRYPELGDADWLRDRFAAGRPLRAIAAELGCSGSSVRHAVAQHGIRAPVRVTERPGDEELREVWAHTSSLRELARRYRVADATAARWLDEAGAARKRRRPTRAAPPRLPARR